MRIWHQDLIPKLCRQHLLAMWREGLGCYKIVTGEVDGGSYKNHPATKEFEKNPDILWLRLLMVRKEMLERGYHPKELPENNNFDEGKVLTISEYTPWQTLEQQIELINLKGCQCQI